MKKIFALILTVIICILALFGCIKKDFFEGDYKIMTQEEAEEFSSLISQALSKEAIELLYKNFSLNYLWKTGEVSRESNLLFTSKGQEVKLSFNMSYKEGEGGGKINYYIKQGYFYSVTEGAQGEVYKQFVEDFDATSLFTLMLFKLHDLIDIDFENFDITALKGQNYEVFFAREGQNYKLKVTMEENAFKTKNHIYAQIHDYNYEAYFVFGQEGFLGAKIDIKYEVASSPNVEVSYYMELYPFKGEIVLPDNLDI